MHFYKRLTTNKLKVQRMVENAAYHSEPPLCIQSQPQCAPGRPFTFPPSAFLFYPPLSSQCPGCILQVPPCHEGREAVILGSTLEDDSGFFESQKVVQIL